jgi:voltage-gated potassium channel Kch
MPSFITRQILLGSMLMIATTVIHSGCTMAALWGLRRVATRRSGPQSKWLGVSVVAGLVLMMFLAALVEVSIWAAAYLAHGALSGVETALYFSMVTFTTLGYGEIVLGEQWRLLASFEAANGIMMFGWTTALIFALVRAVTPREQELDRLGDP